MTRDLRIESLRIRYGSGKHAFDAVRGVDLEVPAGTVTGVLGESGSGKSTLARAIVGLVPARSGTISLGGTALRGRRSRRPIQMVFQDPYASLDPRMTVGDSIREALRVNRRPAHTVGDLLELVGLSADREHAHPRDFSGGQRQRIALARALGAGPDVLIADEITSALDVSVQGSVINLLLELQRQLGFSVLFISHDLPVVRYVSDQVAVMYRGTLVEVGEAARVVEKPEHEYTASLLASYAALTSGAAAPTSARGSAG